MENLNKPFGQSNGKSHFSYTKNARCYKILTYDLYIVLFLPCYISC